MEDDRPVSEIMTRPVIRIRPDAKLLEAADLMRQMHVSGLPVVQEPGRLVGLLSERDLIRDLHRATGVASPRGLLDLLLESAPARGPTLLEACRRRLARGRVSDLMTSFLITIGPGTSVREAAAMMARDGIHRLPVVDPEGQLVGIVSRRDVMASLAGLTTRRARGTRQPRPLRARAAAALVDPFVDI